jgi:hypothetical protein
MKLFKTFLIENQQEVNIMFQLKNFNNIKIPLDEIKYRNNVSEIIDFINIILKNINSILSGNILFSIVKSNLENSLDFIEISVEEKNKKIEVILHPELFDKLISSDSEIDIKNGLTIVKRNSQIISRVLQNLKLIINKNK